MMTVQEAGRKGGLAKSDKKTEANKLNAKKPRKRVALGATVDK